MSNKIIAMWSGPRNLSTALMRSFASRSDVDNVLDEPFYASYLIKTKKNHPMRNEVISSQLNNIDDVKNLCQLKLDGITYQKHMTQHILDEDLSWTESLCNCFLIRNPKEVVVSFKKSWGEGDFNDIGFKQQYDIFNYVLNHINDSPPVIDASNLRKNPKKVLQNLCKVINIDWDESMLSWKSGIQSYDGVWAKHWYKSVLDSTAFEPYKDKELKLNDDEKKIVDQAMPIYESLHKFVI